MANTKVLNLTPMDIAAYPPHYTKDVSVESQLDLNHNKIDAWAGKVTGSFVTMFEATGSASTFVGAGGGIGMSYAPVARIIKEVIAWNAHSGSGDVTRLDMQVSSSAGFTSIFSNAIYKPILSQSYGDGGLGKTSTFLSNVWPASSILKALVEAGAVGNNKLYVAVVWAPSASYGA
jgi:hypothetical protein